MSSLGLLDAGRDDLPGLGDRFGGGGCDAVRVLQRARYRMEPFVEWTGVDDVFEVIEGLRLGE